MVDLKSQYSLIAEEVQSALSEVIESTAFINGPAVQEFQANLEQYLNVKHVIPCALGPTPADCLDGTKISTR